MDNQKIRIPFNGLKDGEYTFGFHIGSNFFDVFETSEIKKGEADINVLLKKSSHVMVVDVGIVGYVEAVCDLCLENFHLPMCFNEKIYVKIGEKESDEDGEMMILSKGDSEIDLTQYIYESIHLSLPYKKVHPLDKDGKNTCNTLMMDKLKKHGYGNEEKTDPRWDKLKDIM